MARTSDVNFQSFLVRALSTKTMTTEQLYTLAKSRNLSLTRSRTKDASRPSQFAWQHQLRRDQHTLATAGVIRLTKTGWTVTTKKAVTRFFAN